MCKVAMHEMSTYCLLSPVHLMYKVFHIPKLVG